MNLPFDAAMVQALVDVADGLELETTLRRILQAGVDLTGAKYGALGVLNDSGQGLQRFIFHGLPSEYADRIGSLPEGLGLLGETTRHPHPLRLRHVSGHPRSSGFPEGHPQMDSFLGLPIQAGGRVFGNIYLTDKPGGFIAEDETRLGVLAAAAGVAVSNAKLFTTVQIGEQWQTGVAELANAALHGEDGGTLLELLAQQAREVAGCELAVVITGDPDDPLLEVVDADPALRGEQPDLTGLLEDWLGSEPCRAPLHRCLTDGEQVSRPYPLIRVGERSLRTNRLAAFPIRSDDYTLGALLLVWRHPAPPTGPIRMRALAGLADQASVSLRLEAARRAEQQLLVFRDRDRIARDLHDLVVQRLFAAGVSLQVLQRMDRLPTEAGDRIEQVLSELHGTIAQIRGTIYELREGLPGSWQVSDRLQRELDLMAVSLGFHPDLEVSGELTTLDAEDVMADSVAVVREALSNCARHARATAVTVRVDFSGGWYAIHITDNGIGPDSSSRRSGLVNLADRARSRGGRCSLMARDHGGSELVWTVPLNEHPIAPVPAGTGRWLGASRMP